MAQKVEQLRSASASVTVEALTLSIRPLLAVRALVPGVHLVEQLVALVNHQHRAFDARLQMRAGHDDGDLQQALDLGVQAGHFAIEPDQVLVGFGKFGGTSVGRWSRHMGAIGAGMLAIVADGLNSNPYARIPRS